MTITLNLLKRFRRLAQAATRIACVLGVTGALLLSSASYAVAPIQMNINALTSSITTRADGITKQGTAHTMEYLKAVVSG